MGSTAKRGRSRQAPGYRRTAPSRPRQLGASLWQAAAKLQQRREINTERTADWTESTEESPPDRWTTGEIETLAGALIDNNVGPDVVRE
jgi:hypothetical protein